MVTALLRKAAAGKAEGTKTQSRLKLSVLASLRLKTSTPNVEGEKCIQVPEGDLGVVQKATFNTQQTTINTQVIST
jgi:hypothetical protein